ncbi:SatD family protein [Mycolicibacterium goodii]|uniref:SatD family protein n=1 Tax=Mycolicibacterium goodii TaxID=134601 RepID=UPI000C25CC38|nr:SatD family protein [Mycolicibacterium goodii]MBU8811967.1 SatD family protein [Mycolicibacterium goodii]MBU8820067.1 SatD family protein [Mycolicibacterium goodii]PJK21832.1 RNA polymerase subunit sigma-70 [Mycolicibacterium goodii]
MVEQASARATLIGDVVGSRSAADRRALHRDLNAALATVAEHAIDAPAFTVGDEFQGSYRRVGEALAAAWAIRLTVAPEIDVRFGIGWGAVSVLDEATGIQDGPGWWAAREAIEWTAEAQRQPGLALVRITYRRAADTPVSPGPSPDAINAALMCRDHMFGSLDERSIRLLRGLLSNRSKKELAAAERISASAVSQRAGRDGLDLIVVASQYLSEIT